MLRYRRGKFRPYTWRRMGIDMYHGDTNGWRTEHCSTMKEIRGIIDYLFRIEYRRTIVRTFHAMPCPTRLVSLSFHRHLLSNIAQLSEAVTAIRKPEGGRGIQSMPSAVSLIGPSIGPWPAVCSMGLITGVSTGVLALD